MHIAERIAVGVTAAPRRGPAGPARPGPAAAGHRTSRRRAGALAAWGSAALASFLTPGAAAAPPTSCRPQGQLSSCIDADNLWPSPGGGALFSVAPTTTTPEGRASFGLVASWLSRPIELRVPSPDPAGTEIAVVDNAVDVTFLWALGITDRLELGLAVPVTFWQDGDGLARAAGTAEELPTTALRDARFGLALSLLQRPRAAGADGPALTARMFFGVPVGDDLAFAGAESATAIPSLAADWRIGKLLLAADLGARIREESEIGGAVVGTQLSAALGATYDVLRDRWLGVGAEVFALWGLSEQAAPVREQASLDSGPPAVPTEFIVSASSAHFLGGDLVFALGGGGGIPLASEPAITAPRFRFDLAVKYAPSGRDSDRDGILDRDDRCPGAAEDKDGFQDEDGCPEEDNDEDGIADASDRCRDAAETVDGHDDEDGCPDDDDDGDGVNDDTDRCRNDKEDRDGFQDGDGCPDPDNDGDGIPDAADRCPSGAEDKDGFEDDDGCPDPDNDQDGVLDAADACPSAAETLDGNRDDDGCPEPGARSLARWNGARVETEQPLRFPAGSATLGGALQKQVAMVVQLVRSRGAEQVIVEGFPDRLGDTSTRAQGLADQRAQAMKAALVAAGVPEARIAAAVGERPTGNAQASVEITVVAQRPKKP